MYIRAVRGVALINKVLTRPCTSPDWLKLGLWPEGGMTKET